MPVVGKRILIFHREYSDIAVTPISMSRQCYIIICFVVRLFKFDEYSGQDNIWSDLFIHCRPIQYTVDEQILPDMILT